MIDIVRGWSKWIRDGLELAPGELGDLFAAFQFVSSIAGFILAALVLIFK